MKPALPGRVTERVTGFGAGPVRWAVLGANVVVIGLCFLPTWHHLGVGFYRIDLDVYRIGARVWLDGGDLYGTIPRTQVGALLPFTYPPIAAVLLAPAAWVSYDVADVVMTALSIVSVAAVLRLFAAAGGLRPVDVARVTSVGLPVALLLEPMRSTIGYGQVNAILMLLVTLDCLTGAPRWPRGSLVGLAAAIKLTPAVFILYFVIRRDRRAALTVAASFVVVNVAVALIAGPESRQYWRHTVFQTDRIGSAAYAANQAWTGFLTRAGLDGRPEQLLWLASVVVVLVLTVFGMTRAVAAGQPAWALSLNALAGLLVSPISWSHHWVWIAPVLLTLLILGRPVRGPGRRLVLVPAGVGLAVSLVAPHWRLPNADGRERDWAAWEVVVGSSYAWFALVLLVLSCRRGGPVDSYATPGRSARRPRHRPAGQDVGVDVEDALADPGAGVEDRPVIL